MAADICIRLGRKIQELRRKRGWRQIDLAAHAELSKTHISELEGGNAKLESEPLSELLPPWR